MTKAAGGTPALWFAIVSAIWGLTFAAARIGVEAVPPVFLSAARYGLVVCLLAPFVRDMRAAFRRDLAARTIGSGLLAITGTYGLLFWGITSTPSGMAGLVNMAIIPVGLFGLGIAAGTERASTRLAGAIALGLGGLVALFWTRLGDGSGSVAGLAAIVAGTLCYCAGSVLARPLLDRLDPMSLTAAHALVGGATLLVASLCLEDVGWSTLRAFAGWRVLASLAFLALAGTIVAYTLYLKLMVVWGTARAGLYAFVSPIVALAAGHVAFGEPIGPVEVAGAILLLAASALATLRAPPRGP